MNNSLKSSVNFDFISILKEEDEEGLNWIIREYGDT